jgi:hypothetical protein
LLGGWRRVKFVPSLKLTAYWTWRQKENIEMWTGEGKKLKEEGEENNKKLFPLNLCYCIVGSLGFVSCTGCWWENLRKRSRWGDPDVDGRIILRWMFRKLEGVVGTGWSWLRIGTGGGHL